MNRFNWFVALRYISTWEGYQIIRKGTWRVPFQTKSVKEGKEMSPIPRKYMVNTPIASGNYTWLSPSSAVKKQVHFTVDEVEAKDRHRRIEQELFKCYAVAVTETLADVVREECYGCQVDHPSQKHHDVCLFMTFSQQVDCFLEEALDRVDEVQVSSAWTIALQKLYPNLNGLDLIMYNYGWESDDLRCDKGLERLKWLVKNLHL